MENQIGQNQKVVGVGSTTGNGNRVQSGGPLVGATQNTNHYRNSNRQQSNSQIRLGMPHVPGDGNRLSDTMRDVHEDRGERIVADIERRDRNSPQIP